MRCIALTFALSLHTQVTATTHWASSEFNVHLYSDAARSMLSVQLAHRGDRALYVHPSMNVGTSSRAYDQTEPVYATRGRRALEV